MFDTYSTYEMNATFVMFCICTVQYPIGMGPHLGCSVLEKVLLRELRDSGADLLLRLQTIAFRLSSNLDKSPYSSRILHYRQDRPIL